ncbi:MAG: alpha/beta hydrolase [Ruminococcus sp.]|uniref:alpha/beta hydrolase n=1 Tax=Ruminococcus sp. TaxID=41978 RepID=UPI0025E4AEF9|nr:alpha/beta hydrolase [Ruminococcus sp.]MCR5541266.1 alpha/beta hydrolase [Ruminococcus sp.]
MKNSKKTRKRIVKNSLITIFALVLLAPLGLFVIWFVPSLKVKVFKYIFETEERSILRNGIDRNGLEVTKNIPYVDDGNGFHLLDVYKRKGASDKAPVIFHIHGGGLFASKKETNEPYCYEWARLGYNVVSISYRLIPDTTLWNQINDCMTALRYVHSHSAELGLDLSECYILGDSAGALLSYFTASINSSKELQEIFCIKGAPLEFDGMGLISIMLETQRDDLMSFITNMVTDENDVGKPYYKYLKDPSALLEKASLPPAFFVTGDEDMIQSETYKLYKLFTERWIPCGIKNYPKGKAHSLEHVFAVKYPDIPESIEVRKLISDFWKSHQDDRSRL